MNQKNNINLLTKRKAVMDFIAEKCQLSDPAPLFIAIYSETGGHPCNECAYNSNCSVLKKFQKGN